MKRTMLFSTHVLLALPFMGGCSGAYWGNLIVLAVSAGIFFGTLSLGRVSSASRSRADASNDTELG